MPFIPVPNTAEVAVHMKQDGQLLANVFHVLFDTQPGAEELTELGEDFRSWWTGTYKAEVSNTVQLVDIVVRDLTEAAGAAILVDGLGQVGATAAAALPNSVALAVKWATGLAGRSFRGRTYHLGMTEPQVDGNKLQPAFHALLGTIYTALLTLVNGTTGRQLAVVSKYSGVDGDGKPIPRAVGIATPIISLSADDTIDNQRRRLPGRGR